MSDVVEPSSGPKLTRREQYEKTHVGIVRTAARLLRERGIDGASVDDVMQAAGLTRGGFYAHFKDKTAMVGEALVEAFREARKNLLDLDATDEAWVTRATERYLSEAHLDNPGRGCALPALASDVARGEPELGAVVATEIGVVLAGIEAKLGGGKGARRRAIVFLSTSVGAMVIARAVGDRELAREVLAAARATLSKPRV
ncbi:MAG TPA: TetR/AcrR family transcriptional regulator [Polyangiaceae bacterium]|jgi:TetR/AcrR family transcriptional repressor of nem operon|nr:TetR/AcrR family transcriptional regulator [Polyangiaceae bacterium]